VKEWLNNASTPEQFHDLIHRAMGLLAEEIKKNEHGEYVKAVLEFIPDLVANIEKKNATCKGGE
jgi:hypothetical protein